MPFPSLLIKNCWYTPLSHFLLHFLLLPPPSSSFFFFTAAQWRPKARRRRPPHHQHHHHTFLLFSLLCLAFCFPFPFPFVGFVFPASPSVLRRETATDGKVRESLHFSFFFFILLSHSHCFQLLFPLFFVPYIFWRDAAFPMMIHGGSGDLEYIQVHIRVWVSFLLWFMPLFFEFLVRLSEIRIDSWDLGC